VAEQAVWGKPFSAEFPGNAEKYGEFREFSIEIAIKLISAGLIQWGAEI
jgi:hypothetical protein